MRLEHGSHTLFTDEQGGVVTGWQHDATDVFAPRAKRVVGGVIKLRGECHPCGPIFGPPPPGWEKLSQHGFLRGMMPYSCRRAPDGTMGTYFFRADVDTIPVFPWNFSLKVHFQLNDQGFDHIMTVSNHGYWGGKPAPKKGDPLMPWGGGIHPYFSAPMGRAVVRIGTRLYEMATGKFGPEVVDSAPEVSIEIPGLGEVLMRLSGLYAGDKAKIILWTDGPYVCVEPTVADPELFGTPDGIYLDQSAKVMACSFSFTPS